MKKIFSILFAILISAVTLMGKGDVENITIVATADIHGQLRIRGARLSTFVARTRATDGDIILIDLGDYLQGTIACHYSNLDKNTGPHGFSRMFGYLHYDALIPGNHDFEMGRKPLERIATETGIPIVCANINDKSTGKTLHNPYTIISRGNAKIAVLGLISPDILAGTPSAFRKSVETAGLLESSRYWVEKIRREEKPDMLILAVHDGFEDSEDNAVRQVLEQVDGIDLCFAAHTHITVNTVVHSRFGKDIPVLETEPRLVEVALVKAEVGNGKTVIKSHEIAEIYREEGEQAYLDFIKEFSDNVDRFGREPICHIDGMMDPTDVLRGPSRWATLMHEAINSWAATSGAANYGIDASLATVFTEKKAFGNDVKFVDFLQMVPYDDQICLVELSAEELEMIMTYNYDKVMNTDNPRYYCDDLYGVNYTVLSNKVNDRRVILKEPKDRNYHILMSSFRAHDGGNAFSSTLGWTSEELDERVIWESDISLIDIIVNYCNGKDNIVLTPKPYWSITEVNGSN